MVYKKITFFVTLLFSIPILGGFFFNYINEKPKFVLFFDSPSIIAEGKIVYENNCASCHGLYLEGQPNWRRRDESGYMPAPPHDETGHTWHHSDKYLIQMTKYGIENLIGKKYPNNMPSYENLLTDKEIIASLSYIKSKWPKKIQEIHNNINLRSE